MTDLPAPLTPAECDLQDFAFMPLHVARLRDSDLAATAHPEACWYAVLLWAAAWHQVPAASLPDDELVLTRLCGLGRDVKTFRRHRKDAMRGFVKCDDGRLYHEVVAEVARGSWAEKLAYRDRRDRRKQAGSEGAKSKWQADDAEAAAEPTAHQTRSARLAAAREKGRHTPEQWAALVTFCGDACVKCKGDDRIVKDHITPIYQGGSDGIDNLQPLCGPCNSSKGPDRTDYRPNGWQMAVGVPATGDEMPSNSQAFGASERLPKGTGIGIGRRKKEKTTHPTFVPRADFERVATVAGLPAAAWTDAEQARLDGWLERGLTIEGDIVPAVQRWLSDPKHDGGTHTLARFDIPIADAVSRKMLPEKPKPTPRAKPVARTGEGDAERAIRARILAESGEHLSQAWIDPIGMRLNGEALHVVAPSQFHADWVTNHFGAALASAAKAVAGSARQISITVGSKAA